MASYILEEKVEEVRSASDIVSVIGRYVRLKRAGKSFVARCPFHREKTPSFNVSPERQIFKCFGCGEGGNVFTFLMKHEHLTFPEAVQVLADQAGIIIESSRQTGVPVGNRERVREVNVWAARQFRRWLESDDGLRVREYLTERGIAEATIRRFGLGWSPDAWDSLLECAVSEGIAAEELLHAGLAIARDGGGGYYDRFRDRLMFPIIDATGRVIAFGGRALGEATPKYINSPETSVFSKGRSVYGLTQAKQALRDTREAIVVEGYTDCLALSQAGVENVVATLGTALTIDHLRLLRRYADVVIVVFDGDEAGQRAAERVLELFVREDVEVLIALMPAGQDPCDYVQERGAESFREVLKEAIPALDFRLRRRLGATRGAGVTSKHRAVEDVLRLVAQTSDEVKRALLVQRTASITGIPEEVLVRDVGRLRRGDATSGTRRTGRDEELLVPGPEKEILQALLVDESLVDEVVADGPDPEVFEHEGTRTLYLGVLAYYERHGRFSSVEFLGGIPDPDNARLAARLLPQEGGSFDARATLRASLAAFEKRRMDQLVRQTEREIEAASAAGDDEELKRLTAQYSSQLRDRAGTRVRPGAPLSGQFAGRN